MNQGVIQVWGVGLLVATALWAGCRKDPKLESGRDDQPSATGTADQLVADSVFLYAQTVYLWNDQLPTYAAFNPRQYASADRLSGFRRELLAISGYALNPETGRSYEYYAYNDGVPKYSYVDDSSADGAVAVVPHGKSLVDTDGQANDLGLLVGAYGSSNSNYVLYVQAVFSESPAYRAGIKRGARISRINGTALGSNYNGEFETIYDAIYEQGAPTQVRLQGLQADGSALDVTLTKASYRPSVVMKDSVYRSGGQAVGYLAMYQFNDLETVKSELDRAFARFATAGVEKLIIDFRYNGGGYVATAEYLTNLIAPSSLSGKTMYSERYNETMQQGRTVLLKKQPIPGSNRNTYGDYNYSLAFNTFPFVKNGGPTGVSQVVFIVSDQTASASEMVINSLSPHLSVNLVGSTTYGKPVGFFPLRIGGYEIYYAMFETPNSEGVAGYFNGMDPDYEEVDDPRFDFGDLGEASLSAAYNYLIHGVFRVSSSARVASSSATGSTDKPLPLESAGHTLSPSFKGMIGQKPALTDRE